MPLQMPPVSSLRLIVLYLIAFVLNVAYTAKSSMSYVPQGSNPLLFTPNVDPIMQLVSLPPMTEVDSRFPDVVSV